MDLQAQGATGWATHDMRTVFLHVPKTAGTSLHRLLCAHVEPAEICPERFGLQSLRPEELARFRLFSGHFQWDDVAIVPEPRRVVTMLRDPRERLLSLYYFWRSHSWEHIERYDLNGPRAARMRSLLEFLRSPESSLQEAIDNRFTRSLVGQTSFELLRAGTMSEQEAQEIAARRLEQMTAVGFFDDFGQSARLIHERLDLPTPKTIPHDMNKEDSSGAPFLERQESREEIGPDICRELDRLTRLDAPLYEEARSTFV
jgi:hypothetical protein